MCERDSCQILDATTTETSTEECKCQASIYGNRQPQEPEEPKQQATQFHHSTKKQKSNVNMLQPPEQQIHHIQQMAFPSNHNCMPTEDASSLLPITHSSHHELCGTVTRSTSTGSSTPPSPTSSAPSSPSSNPPSIGVNLRVTGQCSQGGRKYMEDYFSVAYQQSENAKDLEYAFIGIYDGHGGTEAATFAKEHLMMEIINQKLFWSDSDHDVLRAIREGYIATHYAMWREQEKWPRTANGLLSTAGTTATIAFIRREKIYIGHVGDSGIVLGYQNDGEYFWRAKQLTTDHKPESMAERTRILRSGGKVVVKSGVPRVVWNRPRNVGHRGPIRRNTPVDEVPFLAVARSLGDLWSYNSARNEFVVSPDPDVKVIKINPKTFRCLIFGTDGLWNVVSPQEAVDTVFEKEKMNERLQAHRAEGIGEWTNPSKGLVERALKTWSAKKMRADNTSVVTVILYPPDNMESIGGYAMNNGLEHSSMPNSCGLEYSQICAEIPVQDDGVTYQEMVEKYLPPEEYRNFNYYDDVEQETNCANNVRLSDEDVESDPLAIKYDRADVMCWRTVSQSANNMQAFAEEANPWGWDQKCQTVDYNRSRVAAVCNSERRIGDGDEDDDDDDDDAEDGSDDDDDDDDDASEMRLETENCVINYTQYIGDASTSSSLQATVSNNARDDLSTSGYMSSFAESYNSLLNEQMSQEATASGSNSNPTYQSISGTRMHEILQEQHLYQQQCMSEEEGYSLTKLETRREQQRCSGVQTFKIFQTNDTSLSTDTILNHSQSLSHSLQEQQLQQQQQASAQTLAIVEEQELTEALTWEPACPTISAAMTRFLVYQQQQHQQQIQSQKPLELNSLLQQEREEEQQVALERLEMQRQMASVRVSPGRTSPNTTVVGCVQYGCSTTPQSVPESVEERLVEEYLDEEVEDAAMAEQGGVSRLDGMVQINEVSSSIADTAESKRNCIKKFIEEMEAGPLPSLTGSTHSSRRESSEGIEKIEKIEILREKTELSEIERNTTTAPLIKSPPLPTSYLKAEGQALSLVSNMSRPPKACPARTSLKRSQTLFPNIPNENSRLSMATSAHTLRKRRRYDAFSPLISTTTAVDSTNSNTALPGAPSGSSCSEKRQLRSSGIVDYSKRTLRTRNSLTKDLKAKSSLASTMKRATTQFLHTTAVSLMNGRAATLAQQRQQQRIASHCLTNSVNGDCNRKSRSVKQSLIPSLTPSTSSLSSPSSTSTETASPSGIATLSHVINLRSRQVGQLTTKSTTTTTAHRKSDTGSSLSAPAMRPITTSPSTMSSALRRERRNLRSLSARNTSARSSNGGVSNREVSGPMTHFSKSTRLQASLRNTFGVPPPPSPKLINAVAAVAAATRARSLLTAKSAVASATATRNAAPLSKRASLRSSGGSLIATSQMTTRSSRTGRKLKH